MAEPTIEQKAQMMADGLGIPFYISLHGRITQKNEDGCSREIRPRESAKPIPHAMEEIELLKGVTE
jgi:hypothetical protein